MYSKATMSEYLYSPFSQHNINELDEVDRLYMILCIIIMNTTDDSITEQTKYLINKINNGFKTFTLDELKMAVKILDSPLILSMSRVPECSYIEYNKYCKYRRCVKKSLNMTISFCEYDPYEYNDVFI